MARTKTTPRSTVTRGESAASELPSFYSTSGVTQSAYVNDDVDGKQHFNIIALLAQAQIHNIDITSLTWLHHLEGVGIGGTATISQSIVNAHMRLAFKRIRRDEVSEKSVWIAYRSMISEICSLGQRPIRDHPNILQLQGVCFEVSGEDSNVWPVLVFEQAKYGDLQKFMETEKGMQVSVNQRIDMIRQITSAIMLLHSSNVIHGDIKPGNILIFEKEGAIVPCVSDFGYSTVSAVGESAKKIRVAKSKPWYAPEHTFENTTFQLAQKMDVFSVALFCLWFIFYDQVSGSTELLCSSSSKGKEDKLPFDWHETIESRKSSNSLDSLLGVLVRNAAQRGVILKCELVKCLSRMLKSNPGEREPDLSCLLSTLGEVDAVERGKIHPPALVGPHLHRDFQLLDSILPLGDANYRVRRYIYKELVKQAHSRCDLCRQNAAYQIALSYTVGFSCVPDKVIAEEWLRKSGQANGRLERDVLYLKNTQDTKLHYNSNLSALWSTGHLLLMSPSYQPNMRDLEVERRQCLEEIQQASAGLSANHSFVFALRNSLISVLVGLGDLPAAHNLCDELVRQLIHDPRFGTTSVFTCMQISALAAILYLKGDYTEAAIYQRQVLGSLSNQNLESHAITLSAMSDLSLTYYAQDKLVESRDLLVKVSEGLASNLGEDHPSTLVILNDLASIFYQQGDLEGAEKLFRTTLELKKKVLGLGNRSTLATMGNLALALRYLDKFDDAEGLNRQALRIRNDVLPPDHPDILTNLGNLAATLQARGKLPEAENFGIQCLERTRKILGSIHPETLTSMHNLASIKQDIGRFQDALALYQTCLAGRRRHRDLGPEHRLTLDTVSNMGVLYKDIGMLSEARSCQELVINVMAKKEGATQSVKYLATKRLLAVVLEEMGMYEQALELVTTAYQHMPKKAVDGLPGLALLSAMASISISSGRIEGARETYHRVLDGQVALLGTRHRFVLDTMDALGELYYLLEKYTEAEEYSRKAYQGRQELLPERHPDIFISASNLSRALSGCRQTKIGDSCHEEIILADLALDGCTEVLGPKHPRTIELTRRKASLERDRGNLIEARSFITQAYENAIDTLGPLHPDSETLQAELKGYETQIL